MSWDSIIPPDLSLQLQDTLVSVISGALVVAIGVAMLFDWLALLPQLVPFNSQI